MHTKGKLVIRNNYATGVEPKDYLQWIDADTEDGGQSICDICGIDAEANENAKRIVLSWNSHDKLLEALKLAKKYAIGDFTEEDLVQVCDKIDAAIAAAEGGA